MANINRKRTELIRVDPNFKKWVEEMSRLKSYQEKDKITPSRITQAIYKQYNKYPNLLDEIKLTKLGEWKGIKNGK